MDLSQQGHVGCRGRQGYLRSHRCLQPSQKRSARRIDLTLGLASHSQRPEPFGLLVACSLLFLDFRPNLMRNALSVSELRGPGL